MKVTLNLENKTASIAPNQRFDFKCHREFRAACDKVLLEKRVNAIHVDLKNVDYLDSSALGMLLLLKDKAQHSGHIVNIVNCKTSARQILEVVNFQRLFDIR